MDDNKGVCKSSSPKQRRKATLIPTSAHAQAAWNLEETSTHVEFAGITAGKTMSTLFSYFKPVQDKRTDKNKAQNSDIQKVLLKENGDEHKNKENTSVSTPTTTSHKKHSTMIVDDDDDSDDQIAGVRKVLSLLLEYIVAKREMKTLK